MNLDEILLYPTGKCASTAVLAANRGRAEQKKNYTYKKASNGKTGDMETLELLFALSVSYTI